MKGALKDYYQDHDMDEYASFEARKDLLRPSKYLLRPNWKSDERLTVYMDHTKNLINLFMVLEFHEDLLADDRCQEFFTRKYCANRNTGPLLN